MISFDVEIANECSSSASIISDGLELSVNIELNNLVHLIFNCLFNV